MTLNSLAAVYCAQARYKGVEPLYKRALAIDEKALGSEHRNVAAAATAPELEGTWRVVVTQSGSAPFVAFHTFMGGGAMPETNQFDGAVEGGVRQMPGHGVWRRTGSHTFNHTFEKLLSDTAGNFVARVKIREMIELNSKLDSYSGVATVNVFDPAGNLLFSSCATTQATRMVPEPPSCP
jgi:Tetratricopeptide repeat